MAHPGWAIQDPKIHGSTNLKRLDADPRIQTTYRIQELNLISNCLCEKLQQIWLKAPDRMVYIFIHNNQKLNQKVH